MNYLIVSSLCIFVLFIGVVSLMENELIEPDRKKLFFILAPIIVFEIIIDTAGFRLDGNTAGYVDLYRALKIIEFIVAPVIPTLLSAIIARNSFWEKVKTWFILLIVINAIVQLLNFVIPTIFVITENAEYHRASTGYMYLADIGLCMILLMISSMNAFIQDTKVNFTLIYSECFIVISIVLRLLFEKCNSDWLAISFSYFIFILVYNNSYLKRDSVTSLLNRKVYDNRVKTIKYRTAVVLIDANDFKLVNDTYGHDTGDWALARIGEAIIAVYGRIGYCYRIGGDEFAVILKPGIIKEPQNERICQDKYQLLDDLVIALDKKIKNMIKDYKNPRQKAALVNGVSQGWGICKGNDFEEAFRMADKRLYDRKKQAHEQKNGF